MEPTELETAVINWFVSNLACPELRAQLASPVITSRTFSGAGSYTEFDVPAGAPPLPESFILLGETGPVEGPELESQQLPAGACALL